MERQHVIQLLPLPREMITLIKDYAFPTYIYLQARNYKKMVVDRIETTEFKQCSNPEYFWFWTGYYVDPQIQILLCSTCGNYSDELERVHKLHRRIVCRCISHF